MGRTLSNIVIFAAGAALGSVVTWKLLKTKYEQIADEEIKSVEEYYSRKYEDAKVENTEGDIADHDENEDKPENPDVREYKDILTEQGYTNYSKYRDKEEVFNVIRPRVITPEEFGCEEDYDTISLTYYADGVLTDDADEPIEDVDDVVGEESLNHFGEYEDDSVFVRNDELKCDYEILLDSRNYADTRKTVDPHDDVEE